MTNALRITWDEFLLLHPGDREKVLGVLWTTDASLAAEYVANLVIMGTQQGDAEARQYINRAVKRADQSGIQNRCDLCGQRVTQTIRRLCKRCWQRYGG